VQKRKQADSIFPDRCLESAIKAVKACDEETVSRLTSILATNDRYSVSKLKRGWVQSGPSLKGRTCEVCGKTYDAKNANQKYCSRECVKLAKKRKQITTTDRHTDVAEIAVGALTGETRLRLAALLRDVA
jgi:predicted nucleic acid-binding Zn ribbon protein